MKNNTALKSNIGRFVNRETVLYLIFGILTTLVDNAVFVALNIVLKKSGVGVETSSLAATAAGWVVAVGFAFVTNKLAVFSSRDFSLKVLVKEAAAFAAARAISGAVTVGLMALFVGLIGMNEYAAKGITAVFSLVFNYVASKFFIFKKQ